MARNTTKTDERRAAEGSAAKKPHHTIVSFEANGGFLSGVKLELSDGLNCIIGGRGTGKTSVLELMRYVLGLMPDPKTNPSRAKAIEGLLQANLGDSGRARVLVSTKHGVRYTAERSWDEEAEILDEKGNASPVTFDRDLIFRAEVYSRNEIEEIATTPALQRELLDKQVEADMRRMETELRALQRALEENGSALVRLSNTGRDLAEAASEVPILTEKLKAYEKTAGPDAEKINAAHAQRATREKEKKALVSVRDDLRRAVFDLETSCQSAARRLESRIDEDLLAGVNQKVFRKIHDDLQAFAARLEDLVPKIRVKAEEIEQTLSEQSELLAGLHARQEHDYRKLVQESEGEQERSRERIQVQQNLLEAKAAQKELEVAQKERRACETKRRELTAKLSSVRDARFALRKQLAERLTEALHPHIRISVTQSGSNEGYRTLIAEALKGGPGRLVLMADKIANDTSPDDLASLVRKEDSVTLADRTGIEKDRAKKAIEALRANEELLYKIETAELEDVPQIELLDGTYKPLAALSTGQRCTTILPILLLESERPLLMDQPEDNLDNAFIFEKIVRTLRDVKTKRQLIFVTHNPNIPVLADADRVFILNSNGQRASLDSSGTVDELKEKVETLLEGGKEAFLLRKKRYGH